MSSIKIFMPIFPETINKIYFNGYVNNTKEAYIVIYITNYSATTTKIFKHIKPNENRIIGCCMNTVHQSQQTILTAWPNQLIIDTSETYKLSQLILNNKKILNSNIIVMQYDIHKVMNTETLDVNCNEFEQLKKYLVYDSNMPQTIEYKPLCTVPSWISSSMYIQHCCNQINLLNWLQNTVKRKGKVSLKQGNYIVALIIDILLGYIVLELFLFDRTKNGVLLVGILEKLVNYMYSLLKWLMGAPAGLKLNNAFNKMLGRYFSYHVELWWLFLDVSGEKVDFVLQIIQYLGYFGITFQAAIISDIICITTFHSYCIYVYAARLFNLQISGLSALLRLFVGKKQNPLRGCIDSCQYTNQELFVGTVAFTILLLLLPTTIMYYIVFTLFRVLSLLGQYTLSRLINTVQTLPLYVVALWVTHSSKLAGNIFIETNKGNSEHLLLQVKILNKPLREVIRISKPPVDLPKNVEWRSVVSSVLTGNQII
ncbi:phosphatidylinositol N-acetylglucosaminyltransferase subunit Q [Leptidea sinapis]|uniref:phosphatidylinositol N-acetylglucosaminyltransferase subunit Q n=1 Tax=Leptidea sinapis TaxID=189913 RepID=UPI00214536AE|nr:phosphatidylinositol N-acetylglucosaminyltransferase subunit Q [Leptidea sinapis]